MHKELEMVESDQQENKKGTKIKKSADAKKTKISCDCVYGNQNFIKLYTSYVKKKINT